MPATTTGGPRPAYARPLHCRLWYFDPQRGRPGIPEDVAALIDRVDADGLDVHLVNVNPVEARTVTVQGGAYGEHQVNVIENDGQRVSVDDTDFTVCLAPGCGARLTLGLQRYVNQPTLRFPWNR